jgi:hypothetical protein
MKLSRQHFEFIADTIAPMLANPVFVEDIADKLEDTNPNFNREIFTQRALKNWENVNIPAEHIATLDGLIEQIKDTPRQGLAASIMQKKAEAAQ